MSTNLTDQAYWDSFWNSPLGTATHLSYFYRVVAKILLSYCPHGASAVEVGCGGSVWLPTLALAGRDSWGIDYSDAGVAKAKRLLERWRTQATVVRGDVFDRDSLPLGKFDLVYSLGLLEHFSDGAQYLQRLMELCRPGGYVLTTVPNLAGYWGHLQRRLDRSVYHAHRLFDTVTLDRVHVDAGLSVVEPARYFGGIGPLIVNYDPLLEPLPAPLARAAMGGVWLIQQSLGWSMAPLPQGIRNPRALAGHLMGVYRRTPDLTAAFAPPS